MLGVAFSIIRALITARNNLGKKSATLMHFLVSLLEVRSREADVLVMTVKGKRSRGGCKNCKKSKVKCDEKRPRCGNCVKKGLAECDYTIILQWGGRPYKNKNRVVKKPPNTIVVDGVLTVKNMTKLEAPNERKNSSVSQSHIPLSVSFKSLEEPFPESEIEGFVNHEMLTQVDDTLSVNDINVELFGDHNPIDLKSLQLSMPLPDILANSAYFSDIFNFYVTETSHLFVPAPHHVYDKNPFHTILPQMALQSSTLMNLILAFGANHRNKMITFQDAENVVGLDETVSTVSSDGHFANELLTQTFSELLKKLMDTEERHSDFTLATILMLAGFDIFFSDTRHKWRAHIYGARKIIMKRFKNSSNGLLRVSYSNDDSDPEYFLCRWFSYVNIIASLSSTNPALSTEKLNSLQYDFSAVYNTNLIHDLRVRLKDIEYFTGMEIRLLSLLADVSSIINARDALDTDHIPHSLIVKALELDHEITSYLDQSERERDQIYDYYFKNKTDRTTRTHYQAYAILRATNLIFGLTGVLQLKRRVLGVPQNSKIVMDLLLKITDLIQHRIPFDSSAESCIIFCLFCCGCEIMDDSLLPCRDVYMDHIVTLNRRGMTSALQAKKIMEECWAERKLWWDVLREKNLDITFAI